MASYDLIATGNFTSSASQYSVTNIPGGYTDLCIVISNFRADANSQLQYRFNNTVSSYSTAVWSMNMNFGTTNYSNNISDGFYTGVNYGVGSASFQTIRIYIGQYAGVTDKTWYGWGQAQNSVGTSFETTIFGGSISLNTAITSFQINSGASLSSALVHCYGIIDS